MYQEEHCAIYLGIAELTNVNQTVAVFDPKPPNSCKENRSLGQAKCQVEFDQATFWSCMECLNLLSHTPLFHPSFKASATTYRLFLMLQFLLVCNIFIFYSFFVSYSFFLLNLEPISKGSPEVFRKRWS